MNAIPINSIKIPEEFVNICAEWHGGIGCMLYAVASTGNLTLGTTRLYDTEEKCYLHIWQCLYIDLSRTIRAAKGKKGVSILRNFQAFADAKCSELAVAYGLEDWDD